MNSDLPQSILRRLREVERHASTPGQLGALQVSRRLLHFILGRRASAELEEFIKQPGTAALTPLFVFSAKEEADAWLLKHPAPPHGAIIRAADDLYTVAHVRALGHRKLHRVPSAGVREQPWRHPVLSSAHLSGPGETRWRDEL